MLLRFPCIGDVHLQHTSRRNADRLQALDQIIAESLAIGDIGAWLLLGDLFHQRSSIEDRNDVAPRLQRMADVAPVVILYGNHDGAGDLDILARLKAQQGIFVIARPQVLRVPLSHAGPGCAVAIFGVPYPHRTALVAAGVTGEAIGDTATPLLDAIFLDAAAQLATFDGPTLMIGHATIAGSVSSVGQPMGLERDIAITPALLDRVGNIPKIFGHIHKPQEIHGAYYAGSISRQDWGECEDKRYLIVTFGKGDEMREGATEADGWQFDVESHPVDIAPMFHVEGDLSADGFTWRVTRGPDGDVLEPPATWTGAEVRCRYRFKSADRAALDEAQILATFAEARRLELEPIAIRDRAVRAPEVAAAVTLTDKIVAFVRSSGLSWTPALETKLALLQQPDGGAFLSQITEMLSGPRQDLLPSASELLVEDAEQPAGPDSSVQQELSL